MNVKAFYRYGVWLVLLLSILTPGTVAAQTDQQTPESIFEFTQTAAAFTWKEVEEGKASIEILNNTTTDYQLDITISGIDLVTIVPISIDPNLPAGETLEVTLQPIGTERPDPETYSGFLNVSLSEKGIARHLPLTITVTDETRLQPAPLSDTWDIKYIMPIFFWDRNLTGRYENEFLPIAVTSEEGCDFDSIDLVPDAALGALTLPEKGIAVVSWSGEIKETPEGNCALGLSFQGLDRPGEYSGKIDLLPANDEEGEVTLTVKVTHNIVNPIIVIVLAVVISTYVLKALNINRPILQLLEDEADTEDLNSYTIGYKIVDFEQQRKELRDAIDRLKKKLQWKINEVLGEDNEEYKSIVEDIKSLDAKVRAWNKEFPEDLKYLEAQLAIIKEFNKRPGFFNSTDDLLSGIDLVFSETPEGSQTSFSGRHQKIKKSAELCEKWIHWKTKYEKEQDQFDKIPEDQIDPAITEQFNTVKFELSRIKTLLWETDNLEHFEALDIDKLLLIIEGLLAGLKGYSVNKTLALRGEREIIPISPLIYDIHKELPTEKKARLIAIRRILNHSDIVMFIIALVGGVYAGLTAEYFGQTFGTLTDYIDVFVWGLGAKATVEGIWAAISRFAVTDKH